MEGTGTSEGLGPEIGRYGFSLLHQYSVAGEYPLQVSVTDEHHNVSTRTMGVTVKNEAPVFDLSRTAPSEPVYAGQTVTITGPVSDPNIGDVVAVDVDWYGNGTFSSAGVDMLSGGIFAAQHVYSEAGTFDVAIRATDSHGRRTLISQGLRPVVVLNTPPSNLAMTLQSSTVAEGDTVSLPISFYSPSATDQYDLLVDWGDGSSVATIPVSANPLGGAG